MENKVAKTLDNTLSNFNKLKYEDQAFVRSVVVSGVSNKKIAMEVYKINDETQADIKAMTTLSRPEIQAALAEINKIQGQLLKSKIMNVSDEALENVVHIMNDGIEESERLKAAQTIVKMGVDLVKESDKNNPKNAMKIIIENPSGDININFDSAKIMESFNNSEEVEIIDGDFEEVNKDEVVDQEEKIPAVETVSAVDEKTVDQSTKPKSLFEELTDKEEKRKHQKERMEF